MKKLHDHQWAGLLMFIAGFIIFMGITTAESYYPSGYSTANNEISDLGSTRQPYSVIFQPSATIFNVSMILTGLLVLYATYLLSAEKTRKLFLVPLSMFGLGVLGVGVFPGNTTPHPYFALITFLFGGIAAVLSVKIVSYPYKYVVIPLGVIALLFLVFSHLFIPYLGDGGTERWIAYPISLWLTGIGGYFMGNNVQHPKT